MAGRGPVLGRKQAVLGRIRGVLLGTVLALLKAVLALRWREVCVGVRALALWAAVSQCHTALWRLGGLVMARGRGVLAPLFALFPLLVLRQKRRHAVSCWQVRLDGRTLHGALRLALWQIRRQVALNRACFQARS